LGDVDVLASLNSVVEWSKNTVQNMLPTWAGGSPLTANQLAAVQAQAAHDIHVAAAGNSQLEQQAVAQMMTETSAVAAQAYAAAQAQDTGTGNGGPSDLSAWLLWGALGLLGLVVVIKIVE
jgi:hypothetical protein